MSTDVAIVGEITLDDVVHEGGPCHWRQPGGGALFGAIGALVWGARPRIHAVVGTDYPDALLGRMAEAGIDVSAVHRVAGTSLGVWLLYEHDGRRHQVAKASGPDFCTIDDARPDLGPEVRMLAGVHVAPQSTWGQKRTLEALQGAEGLIVTQDLVVEPFIQPEPYRDGSAIRGATVFAPSEQEVAQLWGHRDLRDLWRELEQRAGIRHLVVKCGSRGAAVVGPDHVTSVPTVEVEVADPTGAGDAFCGGLLVGLAETGDLVEATVRGTVSASFVVETFGAVEAIEAIDRDVAERRAAVLRARLHR